MGADVAGGEPSGADVAVSPDPVGPKAKHVALPLRNMKPTRSEIARSYTSQLSARCNGNKRRANVPRAVRRAPVIACSRDSPGWLHHCGS